MPRWTGTLKAKTRAQVLVPGNRCRRVIDLPGQDLYSLTNPQRTGLMDIGRVTKSTKLVVIEKQPTVIRRLRSSLRNKFTQNPTFHCGDFSTYPLSGSYDLVNLDTMSSPTEESFRWLGNLKFREGGEINLWFVPYRNNSLTRNALGATFLDNNKGYRTLLKMLNHYDLNWNDNTTAKITWAACLAAMNRYDFQSIDPILYCDHINQMYVYRLVGAQKRNKPRWPDLFDLWQVGKANDESYRSKVPGLLDGDMNITTLCITAAKNIGPGHLAYVTRRMRYELERSMEQGHDPKMIKAGWKSSIQKQRLSAVVRQDACSIVDRCPIPILTPLSQEVNK